MNQYLLKSLLIILIILTGCKQTDYLSLPTYSNNRQLQAVVEIPAGTNHKIEWSTDEQRFLNDIRNGKDRIIDFLPYPVNYGFIPSTKMDKVRGGDGDPLDVLIIAESIPSASVVEVIPVGLIKLKDKGEMDHKIIAIPVAEDKRIIKAINFYEFDRDYKVIQTILKEWFIAYDKAESMEFVGFEDEKAALAEIQKWQQND